MDISNQLASISIFVITIAITLYTLFSNQSLFHKLALNPSQFYYGKQYHQIFTSGFLHADLAHLGFNMFSFFFFAFKLEQFVGSARFLVIYLLSMVISVIPSIISNKNNPYYTTIGASGAVSGIVFSSILFMPEAKMMIFPLPIPIPSWLFGILFLLWSYFAAKREGEMINHSAHFYGALAGLIITTIFYPYIWQIFFASIF